MNEPTFRVFVSSTWLDLRPEREAVRDAVLRMRETQFTGMEYFGSRDETTRRASLDEVDRSRVYVGVFAARYGSGITEDEYRRARERGLPCLVYFKDDDAVSDEWREADPAQTARLDALKAELMREHDVSTFGNPDKLAALVTADLHRWLFNNYLTPKLQAALGDKAAHAEAQALLGAVKDLAALSGELVSRLKGAGLRVEVGGDFVAGDKITNIYNAPALSVSALHQLPPPPRDFTGRARELEELASQIERGGVAIAGLQGPGGIGKTALALKLARQLAPRYPDAQFYLDLKGAGRHPLPVADALSHVIRAYHPTARLPEGESELQSLYLSVLHGQRALLLMDNAAGREQVEPLVPPEGCLLLVTSRQHFTLPGLFDLDLETLPPEDARQLLLKIAPRIGERADEIANLCGNLPLALRLAASALAERANLTPADYVRRLSDAKRRLELVEASLTLSYELLSAELQRLWRLLAVFSGAFDAAAAAAVWETDADTALDALGELVKYSLLDWDDDTAHYRLHDLSRLFANSRLSEDEGSAGRARHAAHYVRVLRAAKELYKQGGDALKRGLALFDLEWGNIRAGQSWAQKQSGENDAAAAVCDDYPAVGFYLLMLRQHPRERIEWLEAALAAARRLNRRSSEGVHLGNLSNVYNELGELRRAIEVNEQAAVVLREIGNRHGEAMVLGNLGLAYAGLGEPRRAIEFHEKYLGVAREMGDRRGEGIALGNLGLAYGDLGEPQRAVEFHEQHLAIAREIGDRRGGGNAVGNLGNAYTMLGETQRAVEFYEQQLVIVREIGDRRGEAGALFNACLVFDKLGERGKAIAQMEAALKIFEEIESPYVGDARAMLVEWRREATEGD